MSGSGSSRREPTVPSDPCDRIGFMTNINSPQPSVISTMAIGDVLDVVLVTVPLTSVQVLFKGNLAGVLTGTRVNQLIGCLRNGFTFSATVVSLNGGVCGVRVVSA